MQYSPNKAAEIAGVDRSTVMRAITSGDLHATKKNTSGHWVIGHSDLEAWAATLVVKGNAPKVDDSDVRASMQGLIDALEESRDAALARVDELQCEIAGMAERLRSGEVELARATGGIAALDEQLAAARAELRAAVEQAASAAGEARARADALALAVDDARAVKLELAAERDAKASAELALVAERAELAQTKAALVELQGRGFFKRLFG